MKRYDIGDSYCFGCSSGSLRRGECIHPNAALCWQALIQLMRERATSLDAILPVLREKRVERAIARGLEREQMKDAKKRRDAQVDRYQTREGAGAAGTACRRREAAMRLVACLTMCLMPILANAAHAQAPSDPQGYCVNRSADFYPYTGEPCKSGYQLGSGNCRKTDGRMVAVPREQCVAMAGTVELPFEGGIRPPQAPKPMK